MKRFKSPRQVQRFLSTHDQIANVFSRRPAQDTAAKFRTARSQAFAAWAEVTGATMASNAARRDFDYSIDAKLTAPPVNLSLAAYYNVIKPTYAGAWQLRTTLPLIF